MADDIKRTENVCFKTTPQMVCDLVKLANAHDVSISTLVHTIVRQRLYGDIGSLAQRDDVYLRLSK